MVVCIMLLRCIFLCFFLVSTPILVPHRLHVWLCLQQQSIRRTCRGFEAQRRAAALSQQEFSHSPLYGWIHLSAPASLCFSLLSPSDTHFYMRAHFVSSYQEGNGFILLMLRSLFDRTSRLRHYLLLNLPILLPLWMFFPLVLLQMADLHSLPPNSLEK